MSAKAQDLTSTVAAEVAVGDVLTMPQVARRGPSTRQGKPLHPSTALRWVLKGVKTRDGRRVRLEAVRCGGRWVTSKAAFQRFLSAQTPNLNTNSAPQTPTATQLATRANRAGKELERTHGF
jgi:hypothetical protein